MHCVDHLSLGGNTLIEIFFVEGENWCEGFHTEAELLTIDFLTPMLPI